MGNEIYQLIPRVMHDIGAVTKDRKNEQQKYQFRGIEDFYQAAHPAMVKHGIFCAPSVLERDIYRFDKTNDFGKVTTWCHVSVKVCHRFFAGDGSSVDVVTCGEGLDNSDKATNKAMSGAMKYALIELFCVPTKDVEDSDRDSPEAGRARPKSPVTTEPIPIRKVQSQAVGTPEGQDPPRDYHDNVEVTAAQAFDAQAAKGADAAARPTVMDSGVTYINLNKQRYIHRAFRDALPESIQPHADKLLGDWLNSKGLVKDGKPSTKMIEDGLFDEIVKDAIAFAEGLK